MNKRIILNVMIIAMLTFYMIFNIVYNRLLTNDDPDVKPDVDIWAQPFLVPNSWQLTRLEMISLVILTNVEGNWSSSNASADSATINNIANSWQNLQASKVSNYEQLPLEGKTILAFIKEDSQPLVFRFIEQGNEIHFYRMMDQKLFSFPISSKSQFITE